MVAHLSPWARGVVAHLLAAESITSMKLEKTRHLPPPAPAVPAPAARPPRMGSGEEGRRCGRLAAAAGSTTDCHLDEGALSRGR